MSVWPATVRSTVAYIAVAAYVLLVAPPGLLLALIFRWEGVLYWLGHGGISLGLALCGISYRVAGRQHLPGDGAVLFCSNHQSNIEPVVLFRVLHRRLHFLYKAELRRIPLLGAALEVGGFVPVDRENPERAKLAVEKLAASLRAGNSFLIFPEGTRSKTGELLPFKKGAFVAAIKAQVPIIPVAVTGARDAMRKGSAIIRPAAVSVRIGSPISTTGATLDDRGRIADEVRAAIQQLLDHELSSYSAGL